LHCLATVWEIEFQDTDRFKIHKFDVCLTVHRRYNKVDDQLDATVTIY